ncbi:unnamed protein product [Staurois parvus]|uniref:Uncharacterized protein n=1 Tax=Staurois parvus TaxID=386267 RepID=A0ABN9H5E3_9NEOB|nr:unnamed protein product [Staurois parvus]
MNWRSVFSTRSTCPPQTGTILPSSWDLAMPR